MTPAAKASSETRSVNIRNVTEKERWRTVYKLCEESKGDTVHARADPKEVALKLRASPFFI
jgi:hypothetical protein